MSEDVKNEKTTSKKTKDKSKKKTKNKSTKIYRNTIIAVLVVALVAFIVVNIGSYKIENFMESISGEIASMKTGDGYPHNISTNTVVQMERMGNELAVLTDNSFLVLNKTADVVANNQHAVISPAMSVSKNRSIIYDQGGKTFKVYNKTKFLYEKTLTQNIITCAMGESGVFGIATQSTTAACEFKVYSRNFEELLTWTSSGNHIIDVAVSPNGDKAVISAVGAKSGELISTIYVIDFKHEEPVAIFEYPSTMFVELSFSENGSITAVGDNLISIIGSNNEKLEDILYTDSTLKSLESQNTYNTTALYSVYNSTNLTSAVLIDENANLINKIQIDKNVRFVASNETDVFAITENKIYCYNKLGELFKTIELSNGILDLVCIGEKIYVLDANGISEYGVY